LVAQSGVPFNITTGQDLYQDSIFNTRATFGTCTPGVTGVKPTPYGCSSLATRPAQAVIPINFAEGPGRLSVNLRLSKTFGFGKTAEATNPGARGPLGGTALRGPAAPGARGPRTEARRVARKSGIAPGATRVIPDKRKRPPKHKKQWLETQAE